MKTQEAFEFLKEVKQVMFQNLSEQVLIVDGVQRRFNYLFVTRLITKNRNPTNPINIVTIPLHHFLAFRKVLCPVVGGANFIALNVRQLRFYSNPDSLSTVLAMLRKPCPVFYLCSQCAQ